VDGEWGLTLSRKKNSLFPWAHHHHRQHRYHHYHLCTGLKYTDIQRDALARSYVLDAVDASVEMINIGIRALKAARISDHMQIHVHKNKVWRFSSVLSDKCLVS
jgi:hypothetical protein